MWLSIGVLSRRKTHRIKPFLERAQLPRRWDEVFRSLYPGAVGSAVYKEFQNKTLIVQVNDPLWIGELTVQKGRLRAALNKGRDSDTVEEIRFVV